MRLNERLKRYFKQLALASGASGVIYVEGGTATLLNSDGEVVEESVNHSDVVNAAYKLGGKIFVVGDLSIDSDVIPANLGVSTVNVELVGIEATITLNGARLLYVRSTDSVNVSKLVLRNLSITVNWPAGANGEIINIMAGTTPTIELEDIAITASPGTNLVDNSLIHVDVGVSRLKLDGVSVDVSQADTALGIGGVGLIANIPKTTGTEKIIIDDIDFYDSATADLSYPLVFVDTRLAICDVVKFTRSIIEVETTGISYVTLLDIDGTNGVNHYIVQNNIVKGIADLGPWGQSNYVEVVGNTIIDSTYTIAETRSGVVTIVGNTVTMKDPGGGLLPFSVGATRAVIQGNLVDCGGGSLPSGIVYAASVANLDLTFRGNAVYNYTGTPKLIDVTGSTIAKLEVEGVSGLLSENAGVATLSGDGTTTDFLLGNHGLAITPSDPSKIVVHCTPASADAVAAAPVECYLSDENADGLYESIRAKFSVAPAAGTNNVKVAWHAKVIDWT